MKRKTGDFHERRDPNNDSEPSIDPGAAGDARRANADSDMTFVATEQKKPMNKTSLVLFLIVCAGGGGIYLMHIKAGPQSAGAVGRAPRPTRPSTSSSAPGPTHHADGRDAAEHRKGG